MDWSLAFPASVVARRESARSTHGVESRKTPRPAFQPADPEERYDGCDEEALEQGRRIGVAAEPTQGKGGHDTEDKLPRGREATSDSAVNPATPGRPLRGAAVRSHDTV